MPHRCDHSFSHFYEIIVMGRLHQIQWWRWHRGIDHLNELVESQRLTFSLLSVKPNGLGLQVKELSPTTVWHSLMKQRSITSISIFQKKLITFLSKVITQRLLQGHLPRKLLRRWHFLQMLNHEVVPPSLDLPIQRFAGRWTTAKLVKILQSF